MDCTGLLRQLKKFTEDTLSEMKLPVKVQNVNEEARTASPAVYLMRIPDTASSTKKAPYILHQIVTQSNRHPEGDKYPDCKCTVRTVVCVYSPDEEEGGLYLLNVLERLRIEMMRNPLLISKADDPNTAQHFQLDLSGGSLEYLIYPDDTAPYFVGEMMSDWILPPVKREIRGFMTGADFWPDGCISSSGGLNG